MKGLKTHASFGDLKMALHNKKRGLNNQTVKRLASPVAFDPEPVVPANERCLELTWDLARRC